MPSTTQPGSACLKKFPYFGVTENYVIFADWRRREGPRTDPPRDHADLPRTSRFDAVEHAQPARAVPHESREHGVNPGWTKPRGGSMLLWGKWLRCCARRRPPRTHGFRLDERSGRTRLVGCALV